MLVPVNKSFASKAIDLRGQLFRKYALLFAGMISTALFGSGLLDAWFSYREQSVLLGRIQQEQAEVAADKIGRFVDAGRNSNAAARGVATAAAGARDHGAENAGWGGTRATCPVPACQ